MHGPYSVRVLGLSDWTEDGVPFPTISASGGPDSSRCSLYTMLCIIVFLLLLIGTAAAAADNTGFEVRAELDLDHGFVQLEALDRHRESMGMSEVTAINAGSNADS